ELRGQRARRALAAADDLAEAELPDVRHAFVDACENTAVEEVRSVHRVTGAAQVVCEGVEARRLALGVVEKQHFRHLASFVSFRTVVSDERSTIIDRSNILDRSGNVD